jgi:type VI secretion system secreted protein Hcp
MGLNGLQIAMFLGCFSSVLFGAQPAALFLNGVDQGWIQGDSSYVSLGRENCIECLAYSHMLAGEPDPQTGITGKVRNHFPVTILKRLDKATPLLFRAWRNHEQVEAEFRFFRPSPSGDGTIEHYYTVRLSHAYIGGIRQHLASTLDAQFSNYPATERVSFTYGSIEETWEASGDVVGDEWHTTMTKIPLSDVNFDGIVNMHDFVILADDWLTQY